MLQSKFSKLAVFAASGILATMTAAGPALAASDNDRDDRAPYKGRVIARTGLLLRDAPNTKSRVVGSVAYGSIVRIHCKVNSQNIDGNPRWYLLANGHWAWASARYIENIGPAPHWC
ncbi:SH3 domain-containing protein [Streptomyces sp. NPDC051776]|uniref:SH3 domain-containing protein n=1 Tax=Streptomyces sp. NPDC051776 TaxID=3155414 RepID=UPI00341A2384